MVLMSKFEVALSYSSEDRDYVHKVWRSLRRRRVTVFYDQDPKRQNDLLGSHLAEEFDNVFRGGSQICVLFVSSSYLEKKWPKFEARRIKLGLLEADANSMQSVVIPAVINLTFEQLPDWLKSIGGISCDPTNPNNLARIIKHKLNNLTEFNASFKEAILRLFSQKEYLEVGKKLEKKLQVNNSMSPKEFRWSFYILACAYSRLSEEHSNQDHKNKQLDKSIVYFMKWFENTKNNEPDFLKQRINYVQRDNDLLALRRGRVGLLYRFIGTPNQSPSSDRTDCICLDSQIKTENGTVLAEALRVGMKVSSLIVKNGSRIAEITDTILNIVIYPENNGVVINQKLWCSKTQLIYTSKGKWIAAGDLSIGMQIMNGSGNLISVDSVDCVTTTFPVMRIETANEPHNFIANDILCHNES